MGHVYLVRFCHKDEVLYKIGYTRSTPKKRLWTLRSDLKDKGAALVYAFDVGPFAYRVEQMLILKFRRKCVKGFSPQYLSEIFRLVPSYVQGFPEYVEEATQKVEEAGR